MSPPIEDDSLFDAGDDEKFYGSEEVEFANDLTERDFFEPDDEPPDDNDSGEFDPELEENGP